MRRFVLIFLLVAFALVVWRFGCSRNNDRDAARRRALGGFGQLHGLKATADPKLRAEFVRIFEEEATPNLLSRHSIPDEANAAIGLMQLFRTIEIRLILEKSGEVLPSGEFVFEGDALPRALRFARKYEPQRQAARRALERPECHFGIDFQTGYGASLTFVDVVWICARIEAIHAANALASDDLAGAIDSLDIMLRLAACLAQEPHPTVRIEGAFIRTEAFRVLQALVEHPDIDQPAITVDHLRQLRARIERPLAAWPSDRNAWIGDRALGMHAYELTRSGRLRDLLTDDEVSQFKEEDSLHEISIAARRWADRDELFYLQTMRKIIAACDRPYYARTAVFKAITDELHRNRNAPDFPLVAARLLLPEIEKGHAIQARDRANCESWAVALSLAAGDDPPPYKISPASGGKYEILVDGGLVTVWDVGQSEEDTPGPVVVPDLAADPSER